MNSSSSGGCGAFAVLPIDIMKTRVQSAIVATTPTQIFKEIYGRDGFRGFYKGGTTQIL